MKTKLLSLFFLVFLITSCQNGLDNDLTLRLVTSSKLTVKVVDSKGTSLANVNVKLYDRALLSSSSSSFSSLQYIYSTSTDANGKVDFGDVAAGTYFIFIDSVRVNGLNYQPIMQFQINSAVDKNITINPEDYATTFNFNFKKAETSKTSSNVSLSAFNNLNIMFIPYASYVTYSANPSYYSSNKFISLAEVTGKTNDAGYVSLKVPAFKSYVAVVYNDAKTVFCQLNYSAYSSSYTYTGDKGETANYNYSLDSKTLLNAAFGTYNLTIKKAISVPTSTSPSLIPFDGINVAAIPSSVYDSYIPLSVLLESTELSGKTDADGNISFSLKSGISYIFVAYNDDKSACSILSVSSSSYFNVYQGETRQVNFTINPTNLAPVAYSRINITLNKTASVYYTSSPTDLTPFSNLQVALVPYLSSNSTSSVDDLLSKAVASGTTDANGQILFTLAMSSTNYTYSYYQIVAYDAAKTNKFLSSSLSVYTGNSTSQSYILNSTSLATVN
ncbi:MAG: carboxypeptidase-like regulatory domain-containing protein [Paludibacter sp.]|nr:carboxypeptidase-like regulatory domain-containing protein [Paludibacter sp.]